MQCLATFKRVLEEKRLWVFWKFWRKSDESLLREFNHKQGDTTDDQESLCQSSENSEIMCALGQGIYLRTPRRIAGHPRKRWWMCEAPCGVSHLICIHIYWLWLAYANGPVLILYWLQVARLITPPLGREKKYTNYIIDANWQWCTADKSAGPLGLIFRLGVRQARRSFSIFVFARKNIHI